MDNKSNLYLKLYANCVLVKGYSRSSIADLQRGVYHYIPNDLYEILTDYVDDKTIGEILESFDSDNRKIVLDYFNFLTKNELAFTVSASQKDFFPKLGLDWDSPSVITNSIIDFDSSSKHSLSDIVDSLNHLGCKAIEMRFYDDIQVDKLIELIDPTMTSRIRTIYIKMQYNPRQRMSQFNKLLNAHSRVKGIFVYGAPKDKIVDSHNFSYVAYLKREMKSEECCGNIDIMNFRVNMSMFTESQEFNSCLNRKISVDRKGNIKACPSTQEALGHIKLNSLEDIVTNSTDLKKKWSITKDQIDDCKVCEHRYFCTDCRVYTKDPQNEFSKPEKCNYDPYTNEWQS